MFGPFKSTDSRAPADRPIFTAGIRGKLFKRGKVTTRSSHFLAKFRLGLPTRRAEPMNERNETTATTKNKRKLMIKTNETAGPRNDKCQRQTRTNNVDKRNHRPAEQPKQTPNANLKYGQTKPPQTLNNQSRRRDKRPNRNQPQALDPCRKHSLVLTGGPPPHPRVHVNLLCPTQVFLCFFFLPRLHVNR